MAITIDRPNYVINVPRNDMTLVQSSPVEIRQLDTNAFRLTLRDLDDDDDGRPWDVTHDHVTEVNLSGIIYARFVLIRDPYTITFEDGQYVVQLVGSNNNIIEKTNKNQVSLVPSNAAGLITPEDSEAAAFAGRVYIDVANTTGKADAGTLNPTGQLRKPSDNLTDTALIADFRGIPLIHSIGDITLSNEAVWDRLSFEGDSPSLSTITINPEASVVSCLFYRATITGTLDGGSSLYDCDIGTLNFVDGKIFRSGIGNNTITLSPTAFAELWECKSRVAGALTPTINCGGGGILSVREYTGGLRIENYTGAGAHTLEFITGQCILDSTTVTSGTFVIRSASSNFKLIDELGNNIPEGTWNTNVTIIRQTSVWDELTANHVSTGTFGALQARIARDVNFVKAVK